jgi:adenosine 3'-phospho 5'-phosphosulfate transporter B2
MIPVMIWGILIMRKRYGLKDFLMAVTITMGCTLFLVTGSVKSKVSKSMWDSSVYGCLLMLGYLGFDGFTSTFQDKLFKGYQMTTYNQILYTTLCSAVLSAFGGCLYPVPAVAPGSCITTTHCVRQGTEWLLG